MACELSLESEGDFHAELCYEEESSSLSSRSGSLEFLLASKNESFVEEIHIAQALFPDFFVKRAMKGLCKNISETLLACDMDRVSGPEKEHCKSISDAIEIWYIKEYGLVKINRAS